MYNIKEIEGYSIKKATIKNNMSMEIDSLNIRLDKKTLLNIFNIADKKIINKTNNNLTIQTLNLEGLNIDFAKPTSFIFELLLRVVTNNGNIKYYEVTTPHYNYDTPIGIQNILATNNELVNLEILVYSDNINNFVITEVID